MEKQTLVQSLNSAVEGFIYVLRTERNMRIHFLSAVLIVVVGIYFDLPKEELLLLTISLTIVLVLEMINTAVEVAIDLIEDSYNPIVRIIKNITAGAVFLSALNALAVVYVVFSQRFGLQMEDVIRKVTRSPWHLTFIALFVVMFLVVTGKVFLHKGTPFKGGMPSGHAAFAFSIWTIIVFSTENGLIMILSFIMAFLIARHRFKDKIHTVWDVFAGALLGMLATAFVFQLFI